MSLFQSNLRKQIRNFKFAENFEFCENYSLFFKIIHWCPYAALRGLGGGNPDDQGPPRAGRREARVREAQGGGATESRQEIEGSALRHHESAEKLRRTAD